MINLAREAWRPLFLREPVAQRVWSLFARALRAYLLQVAEDDGRLLKSCSDPRELAKGLGIHADEVELAEKAILTLINDGFLRWEGAPGMPGWLGIDRLVTFGPDEAEGSSAPLETPSTPPTGESPQERKLRLARARKERWRQRQRTRKGHVPAGVPGDATVHVPERTSPPTPPSPGHKNTKKTGQNRETPTRDEGVPVHVPGASAVPTGDVNGVHVDGNVLTALTSGKFEEAQALVRGAGAAESQEAAP